MTQLDQHDFRAATIDAKRRLEGAKKLQHLAARRAAESFLAGDVPAADDIVGHELVLAGLAALEVRAQYQALGDQSASFSREAKELPQQIPPLDARLGDLYHGRVPEVKTLIERDREMDAARAELESIQGRINRAHDHVFELSNAQTALMQQHPEAFYEAP